MKQILGILSVIIVVGAVILVLFGKVDSNDEYKTSTTTMTEKSTSLSVESIDRTSLNSTTETTID